MTKVIITGIVILFGLLGCAFGGPYIDPFDSMDKEQAKSIIDGVIQAMKNESEYNNYLSCFQEIDQLCKEKTNWELDVSFSAVGNISYMGYCHLLVNYCTDKKAGLVDDKSNVVTAATKKAKYMEKYENETDPTRKELLLKSIDCAKLCENKEISPRITYMSKPMRLKQFYPTDYDNVLKWAATSLELARCTDSCAKPDVKAQQAWSLGKQIFKYLRNVIKTGGATKT